MNKKDRKKFKRLRREVNCLSRSVDILRAEAESAHERIDAALPSPIGVAMKDAAPGEVVEVSVKGICVSGAAIGEVRKGDLVSPVTLLPQDTLKVKVDAGPASDPDPEPIGVGPV